MFFWRIQFHLNSADKKIGVITAFLQCIGAKLGLLDKTTSQVNTGVSS